MNAIAADPPAAAASSMSVWKELAARHGRGKRRRHVAEDAGAAVRHGGRVLSDDDRVLDLDAARLEPPPTRGLGADVRDLGARERRGQGREDRLREGLDLL